MKNEDRHICTKDDPWTPEKSTRAAHPDSYQVGEQEDGYPGGDIVTMECPWCKTVFRIELPQ